MFRALALSCLTLASLAPPALALEHIVEYRFNGSEIQSYTAFDPEPEDPWTITIDLNSDAFGPRQLVIETDGDNEDCIAQLNIHKGDPHTDLVIRMHMNASTMNGIMMIECSTRYRP
ncbi:MAG: hypothetical protein ACRBB0_18855 [Pelagimonas sp.]|uniref:hypothetical protein n=1 Tax=Pelagimonas sp. TaxID=2073170 RepID=UPI003D6A5633